MKITDQLFYSKGGPRSWYKKAESLERHMERIQPRAVGGEIVIHQRFHDDMLPNVASMVTIILSREDVQDLKQFLKDNPEL